MVTKIMQPLQVSSLLYKYLSVYRMRVLTVMSASQELLPKIPPVALLGPIPSPVPRLPTSRRPPQQQASQPIISPAPANRIYP